jgi:hypothetical protein
MKRATLVLTMLIEATLGAATLGCYGCHVYSRPGALHTYRIGCCTDRDADRITTTAPMGFGYGVDVEGWSGDTLLWRVANAKRIAMIR